MPTLFDQADLLCHYTSADTAFRHILPTGQLLMNRYAKMRDPFENKRPQMAGFGGWGNVEAMERTFWAVMEGIASVRESTELLSLTTIVEGSLVGSTKGALFSAPYARPRMWEQYGDNHAGVCLVFDRPKLLEAIPPDNETGKFRHGPVEYTLEGFAGSEAASGDFGDFATETLDEDIARHAESHWKDLFLLKTDDWQGESEYRILFEPDKRFTGDTRPPFFAYGESLTHVIVGERFPEWQLPAARAAVSAMDGVELRSMTWRENMPFPAQDHPPTDATPG